MTVSFLKTSRVRRYDGMPSLRPAALSCVKECPPHGIFPECDAKVMNCRTVVNSVGVYTSGYVVKCLREACLFMVILAAGSLLETGRKDGRMPEAGDDEARRLGEMNKYAVWK